jgi:hypothetical protein
VGGVNAPAGSRVATDNTRIAVLFFTTVSKSLRAKYSGRVVPGKSIGTDTRALTNCVTTNGVA